MRWQQMPGRLALAVLAMLVAATVLWQLLSPPLRPDNEPPADVGVEGAPVDETAAPAIRNETHAVGSAFRDCETCPEMVVVPAGSFTMGSPAVQAPGGGEKPPLQQVSIPRDFAVGKFEVTFAEWEACVDDGGCRGYQPGDEGWGRGNRPVINVSWEDAQAYVAWLKKRTGKAYRLLSEAEWEYAARAGTTTAFPWGAEASHEHANYGQYECCSGVVKGRDLWMHTAPVGSLPANSFGLHDMHGNVWELTEDCFVDEHDAERTDSPAETPSECPTRVLRGGSWLDLPRHDRPLTYRLDLPTASRSDTHGFRVARPL